jgi:hypothetical protein
MAILAESRPHAADEDDRIDPGDRAETRIRTVMVMLNGHRYAGPHARRSSDPRH